MFSHNFTSHLTDVSECLFQVPMQKVEMKSMSGADLRRQWTGGGCQFPRLSVMGRKSLRADKYKVRWGKKNNAVSLWETHK